MEAPARATMQLLDEGQAGGFVIVACLAGTDALERVQCVRLELVGALPWDGSVGRVASLVGCERECVSGYCSAVALLMWLDLHRQLSAPLCAD